MNRGDAADPASRSGRSGSPAVENVRIVVLQPGEYSMTASGPRHPEKTILVRVGSTLPQEVAVPLPWDEPRR